MPITAVASGRQYQVLTAANSYTGTTSIAASTLLAPVRAASQAVSLATMPAFAVPDVTSFAMWVWLRRGMVCPRLSSTPAVAPAITRRLAWSRDARLPASVSALTLNNCPAFDALTQAITGT